MRLAFSRFVGLALVEVRRYTRLFWYWALVAAAVCPSLILFVVQSGDYHDTSSYSSTRAPIDPRYLIASYGCISTTVMFVGVIFLGFDSWTRDRRSPYVDAVASRSVLNLEIVGSKVVALALVAWFPALVLGATLQVVGVFAVEFGGRFGRMLEPASLTGYVIVNSFTATVFWSSAVVFLGYVLRNRLVVVVVAITLLAIQLYGLFRAPLYLVEAFSIIPAFSRLASDLLPLIVSADELAYRLLTVVVGLGLVVIAAALVSRPDSRSPVPFVAGGVLVTATGAVGVAALVLDDVERVALREHWVSAHGSAPLTGIVDLVRLSGKVVVIPGDRLVLDVALDLRTATDGASNITLSFNPGMRVSTIDIDGHDVEYEHADGILAVALPSPSERDGNSMVTMALRAEGDPDSAFGYLDATIDPYREALANSQLHVLGLEASIFESEYVALMPGVRWFPVPGTNFAAIGPRGPIRDFFDVDVEVTVPTGWSAVGPGRSAVEHEHPISRFRFKPASPIPSFGLIAARFERYSTKVDEVELELLLHDRHLHNVDLFSSAIDDYLRRDIVHANPAGMMPNGGQSMYPFRSLSIVEVPGRLRGFGGGWRMAGVQSLPGVLFLGEYGFPTAHFASVIADRPDRAAWTLGDYFARDYGGGNLASGLARHFYEYRTSPRGTAGLAIDLLAESLIRQEVRNWLPITVAGGDYFSAYAYLRSTGSLMGYTELIDRITNSTKGIYGVLNAVATAPPDSDVVWDLAERTSLAELDGRRHPRAALGVLRLRVDNAEKLLRAQAGGEKLREIFRDLVDRFGGRDFSLDEFLGTVRNPVLESTISDLLFASGLPGYMSSPVVVSRLKDADSGKPRFQVGMHVRNDEPVAGTVRMVVSISDVAPTVIGRPVEIPGNTSVELGIISDDIPEIVWLETFMSLNRDPIVPEIVVSDREDPNADGFEGARNSGWTITYPGVLVDDLDEEFRIERTGSFEDFSPFERLRVEGRMFGERGSRIPLGDGSAISGWSREEGMWNWGKYRRTVARVDAGRGLGNAIFSATIPESGKWKLYYHMPRNVRLDALGAADMVVIDGGKGSSSVRISGADWVRGWNYVGEFDLRTDHVEVAVSDRTDGRFMLADAIMWRKG